MKYWEILEILIRFLHPRFSRPILGSHQIWFPWILSLSAPEWLKRNTNLCIIFISICIKPKWRGGTCSYRRRRGFAPTISFSVLHGGLRFSVLPTSSTFISFFVCSFVFDILWPLQFPPHWLFNTKRSRGKQRDWTEPRKKERKKERNRKHRHNNNKSIKTNWWIEIANKIDISQWARMRWNETVHRVINGDTCRCCPRKISPEGKILLALFSISVRLSPPPIPHPCPPSSALTCPILKW